VAQNRTTKIINLTINMRFTEATEKFSKKLTLILYLDIFLFIILS
jgi:hypothetical protein